MKINDPNALGTGQVHSTGVSRSGQTGRSAPVGGSAGAGQEAAAGAGGDGVQLSDLVQNLRSLDTDSPERQAKVDQLAKAHAEGKYQVDAEATAGKIVDDAIRS
ncbi:MAG: flagellar biosynthesis anti-sigma factor FlgM [Acidobacteriota bacterium]